MKISFSLLLLITIVVIVTIVLVVSRLSNPVLPAVTVPPVLPEEGCENLSITLYQPSSNDFFSMHFQSNNYADYFISSQNWINARIKDLVFPISPKLNDPIYPIFGYDNSSQLSLSGGNRYNDNLTDVRFRLHMIKQEDEIQITESKLTVSMAAVSKFFTERGFQIASPDFRPGDEYTFINNFTQATSNDIKSANIYLKGIFNANNELAFIDFCAYNGIGLPMMGYNDYKPGIDQPNLGDNRDFRFGYPLRIPVAQTCIQFESLLGTQPIAYYRQENGQLSIDVPDGTDYLFYYNPSIEVLGPGIFSFELRGIMQAFSGVFGTFRRSGGSIVKSNNFLTTDYIAQVSNTVRIKSDVQESQVLVPSPGVTANDFLYTLTSEDPDLTNVYAGIILPKIGAGSREFDIIVLNPGLLNGFSQAIDPYLYRGETINGTEFGPGDNIHTHVVEVGGTPNNFTVFDDSNWSKTFLKMPSGTLSNPPTPENVSTVGMPDDSNNREDLFLILNVHEYVHAIHQSQGVIFNITTEAIATSIEMLSEINDETFTSFRPSAFASYITNLSRGYWPFATISRPGFDFATYGGAMLYHHMIKKYDKNAQALRRASDILSSVYQKSISDLGVNTYLEYALNGYGGGERLSMQTAYNEILSRDFIDDYCDSMVAMCILRNNSSIPSKYQSEYPYWVSSSDYPYNNITDSRYTLVTTDTSFIQPSVGGTVTINVTAEDLFTGKSYLRFGNQRYGVYDVTVVERIDANTVTVELELLSVLDGQIPGTVVPSVSQIIRNDHTKWWDFHQNNELFWNPSIQFNGIPNIDDFHTIIPSLEAGTINRDLEDLATLIYDVDPFVNSITITSTVSNFKVTLLQFNPDGGAGTFQQLPSVGNLTDLPEGNSVTYTTSSLSGTGRKRLVITHSNITDWATILPYGPASNLLALNAATVSIIPSVNTGSITIQSVV